MPTELVLLGGITVVAAGALIFVFLRNRKPATPLHLR
jgi:hypothetical protein